MDQKAMRRFSRYRLANLLQRPTPLSDERSHCIARFVEMRLQNQKHIDKLKLGRDNHHEVAGDNRRRVVPHEGRPVLRGFHPPVLRQN